MASSLCKRNADVFLLMQTLCHTREFGLLQGHTRHGGGRVCIAMIALAAALTSAFDLAVHTVNLCQHVFGPGLHLQVG